jgi:hypothetical protein
MKNYNDHVGNRARDLPVCIAVFQPTAPPRSPSKILHYLKYDKTELRALYFLCPEISIPTNRQATTSFD